MFAKDSRKNTKNTAISHTILRILLHYGMIMDKHGLISIANTSQDNKDPEHRLKYTIYFFDFALIY